MARTIRLKFPTPAPTRATKSRESPVSDLSSLDLSDDDGYSAVEEISESEDDDEEHVVAAEEEHIISAVSRRRSGSSRPPIEDDESEDADEESEAENSDDDAESDNDNAADDDEVSWNGISSDLDEEEAGDDETAVPQPEPPVERHVRFAGVPDSDSDSTTSETSDSINDFFPDIFVEQSALDPAFRREIEQDDETSSNSSFWDFQGSHEWASADTDDEFPAARDSDMTPMATPRPSQPPTEVSTPVGAGATTEVQESDGYETDGDTTEEEPEPVLRRRPGGVRRVPSIDSSSESETETPIRTNPGKPRVGRFNLNRSDKKPIGVVDPTTGKMIIFTPRRQNQLDLSPESLQVDFTRADLNASPLVRNPGFIMMGAMVSSNTFGDFMNMQPYGPAEAFFPTSDALTGEDSDDSYLADLQEEDEDESMLKLEDFITFGETSSDDEAARTDDWNDDLESSPTRAKLENKSTSETDAASSAAHKLLTHFDQNPDAVGAFRRNQINQQLIYSDKASQESLAFSGPYHYGTLRGIKSGSMEAVTAPITPIRRQKRSMVGPIFAFSDFVQQSSPLNMYSSQKRKASHLHDGNPHKRYRSISDMEVLGI